MPHQVQEARIAATQPRRGESLMSAFISYALYPLLLLGTLALLGASLALRWPLATVFTGMAAGRLALLLLVECLHPARPAWRMSWASFRRDLKYMAVNGGVTGLLKWMGGWLALDLSRLNTGLVSGLPMPLEFLALLLGFELIQYGFHRLSHEGRGRWGRWLWKVHVAHHLPDRVYLLMHPVGHPINALLSLLIMQVPLVVLGARQETLFLFNALMGLQGLVSHLNVDIKAGPLNYLLVGTELHRQHHSSQRAEAGNYGVLTPFWDLVFGTFVYHPRRLPEGLGVEAPGEYPDSHALRRVLMLPFR